LPLMIAVVVVVIGMNRIECVFVRCANDASDFEIPQLGLVPLAKLVFSTT